MEAWQTSQCFWLGGGILPGLDVSLELQPDPANTGSEEAPPGVLDLRSEALHAARVEASAANRDNVDAVGLDGASYEAAEIPPADDEEQAGEPAEEPVLEQATEEESDGPVVDQDVSADETAANDPADEQGTPEAREAAEDSEEAVDPVQEALEVSEPETPRPVGLIRFQIRPQAKPKMQAQWPSVSQALKLPSRKKKYLLKMEAWQTSQCFWLGGESIQSWWFKNPKQPTTWNVKKNNCENCDIFSVSTGAGFGPLVQDLVHHLNNPSISFCRFSTKQHPNTYWFRSVG